MLNVNHIEVINFSITYEKIADNKKENTIIEFSLKTTPIYLCKLYTTERNAQHG